MKTRAFTLIELLIVVAIIAILAAIAVPNFLEAQVRAKVSRSKADIRSIATALETYRVDNNGYPVDGGKTPDNQAFWYITSGPTVAGGPGGITSPIAYMTSGKLVDPFRQVSEADAARVADAPDSQYFTTDDYRRFRYRNRAYTYGLTSNTSLAFDVIYGAWHISSGGPDRSLSFQSITPPGLTAWAEAETIYDPTNGTVSRGDIVRSQKYSDQIGGQVAPGL